MRRATVLASSGLAALVLAGCGGGSTVVVRPPDSTLITSPPTLIRSTSVPVPSHPAVRIVPSTALHDGQSVQVVATGFRPGEALQVVQCAAKGAATGAGDCNLSGMLGASAGADGRLTVTLTVRRGPFGASAVVCGANQPCLISVTQASLSPTDEADAPIRFAAG